MENMTLSKVKTENGNVSYETPEGTVVHININQRSCFDCLLDTVRFFQDMKRNGKIKEKKEPTRTYGSAGYLGFGVAYISLGLVSVMLAIIIAITQPSWSIFYTGLHFWVGFPFIVSGIVNLVAYKYPKAFWVALAFISLLACCGVSIAGMVFAAGDVDRLRWSSYDDVCSTLRYGRRDYYAYGTTRPPRYNDYSYDYELERCKNYLQSYQKLMGCLVIMTLLMTIWGLCLSIFGLISRVLSCCHSCALKATEEDDDSLIKPDPSDDIIIA